MAGTNNFQQWNPTAANQESDATYTGDALRSGGATSGAIFPSPTANKLFFQLAQMTCGLAGMMANKGYNVSDANLANLIAALTNIVTNADVAALFPGTLASTGWTKLPNGLILKWGLSAAVPSGANSGSVDVTFAPAFTTAFAAYAVANAVSPGSHGGSVTHVTFLSPTKMTITIVNADASNHVGSVGAFYFAIGV